MKRITGMPLAYGYIRYSSDQQEEGDTLRRQRDGILAWVKRNAGAVHLDTSMGDGGFFIDEGMTGFATSGTSRGAKVGPVPLWAARLQDYALGEFLRHCESGRVQPGSYLVVESADRLSRESPVIALNLFTQLLMFNVVLVTLSPEMEYRTDADIGKLLTAGITIDRAHDESRIKKRRCANAWSAKQANARSAILTTTVPAWCEVVGVKRVANRLVGGEIRLNPAKVAVIRRMYTLAMDGIGCRAIARKMNAERVPVLGRSKVWTEFKVYHLLTNRALLGEYRPHTGRTGSKKKARPDTRKATGEVIEGYYPAVLSPAEFDSLQGVFRQRANYRGRRGKHLNLFAGMLTDARDGGTLSYRHVGGRPSTLIPLNGKTGVGEDWSSFPAAVFEAAVISRLAELKAVDVLQPNDHGNKVFILSGRRAAKEAELREFRAEIDQDPRLLRSLKGTLIRLETELDEITRKLAEAQREAASPLSEAWGEFRGLADVLAKDESDELRSRCRVVLRRLVESITCLFTGPKMTRMAAVRVQFRSGLHRDYVIVYLARNRQRRISPPPLVASPPTAWYDDIGAFDLRNREHAQAIEKLLVALDPATLETPGANFSSAGPKPTSRRTAK